MNILLLFLVGIVLCSNSNQQQQPRTVKELVTYQINNFFYCNKFLTNSQEVGCWSNQYSEITGVLYRIETYSDINIIQNDILTDFIVYFKEYFQRDLINEAIVLKNVRGVLIFDIKYNVSLTKPTFIITNKTEQDEIDHHFESFNQLAYSYNLTFSSNCYISFKSSMTAFTNSQRCLRRSSRFDLGNSVIDYFTTKSDDSFSSKEFCTKVNFPSIWAFINKTSTIKSKVLIINRLNNLDYFKQSTDLMKPTRLASYSVIVSITLANLISKSSDLIDKEIIFGMLGSEQDNYLGTNGNKSSIFYADKIHNKDFYKITTDNLSIVELDRLEWPEDRLKYDFHLYQTGHLKTDRFCSNFSCIKESFRNESFLNHFNLSGVSIASHSENKYSESVSTLVESNVLLKSIDLNGTIEFTIDLVMKITSFIFDSSISLDRNLIDRTLLKNMLLCSNWISCSSLTDQFVIHLNDSLEYSALLFAVNSSNDSLVIMDEFVMSDTLTRSNEDEVATMSLFLKSNNDYVYLTFGITFSVLTIIVTFVLKNM